MGPTAKKNKQAERERERDSMSERGGEREIDTLTVGRRKGDYVERRESLRYIMANVRVAGSGRLPFPSLPHRHWLPFCYRSRGG